MHSSTLQAADYVKNQAMGEIQGGGKAKTLGARIAKKLGGITQGPMGRLLEGAVDMGAAAMFGPEAGIATAAMFQALRRTNDGVSGDGTVNTYHSRANAPSIDQYNLFR